MNSSFSGREAVSREINAKYHFWRQVSDFGPFLGEQRVISRHTLQVECWFLDNNLPMDHMDRTNTSFSGHEGVSEEINAKYLIFDDFSVFAISAAHRDGFCERMCPSLQVGVYLPNTTLPWDHRRLIMWENSGRFVVCCLCEGHVGRMGGQICVWRRSVGGRGFDPDFVLVSGPSMRRAGFVNA